MKLIAMTNSFLLLGLVCWLSTSFEFVDYPIKNGPLSFNDTLLVECYEPSVKKGQDYSSFHYVKSDYILNYGIEQVWEAYTHMNPHQVWNGPINQLRIYKNSYGNYEAEQLDEGSIVLIDLNLFKNKKLRALFKIREVNDQEKIITLCYGQNNTSHGEQIIRFHGDGEHTEILHETYYKSNSGFRDVLLYPTFHKKCINEYHERMRQIVVDRENRETVDSR